MQSGVHLWFLIASPKFSLSRHKEKNNIYKGNEDKLIEEAMSSQGPQACGLWLS